MTYTIQIYMFLLLYSCLVPIFNGYFASFCIMVILLINIVRPYKLSSDLNSNRNAISFDKNIYLKISKPIVIGLFTYVSCLLLASLFSASLSGQTTLAFELEEFSHTIMKFILLPVVLWGFVYFHRENRLPWKNLRHWISGYLVLYALYCIYQKYTGVDWIHGLDAVLPPNRFAGTFRVSGFVDHPLTLSYCLVFLTIFTLCLAKTEPLINSSLHRIYRYFPMFAVFFIIFISGSKFPIFLGFMILAGLVLTRKGGKNIAVIAGIGLIAGLLLILDSSLRERSIELWQRLQNLDLPRFRFWKAYWQIFVDNPIWGAGAGNIHDTASIYYNKLSIHDKLYIAHNNYLQTLGESGVIGLFGLCSLFVGMGIAGWRSLKATKDFSVLFLMAILMLACLVQNIFNDSETSFCFWFVTFSIIGFCCTNIEATQEENRDSDQQPSHSKS